MDFCSQQGSKWTPISLQVVKEFEKCFFFMTKCLCLFRDGEISPRFMTQYYLMSLYVQKCVLVSDQFFFQRFSVESRMELNEDTVEIIKATAPVLKEHGLAITIRFYENLFKNHPYVNQFFNKNHIFPKNGEVSQQVKIKFSLSKSHLKVI